LPTANRLCQLTQDRGDVQALFAENRSRGLQIGAETPRCQWIGERMDYSMAVGYLIDVRDEMRAAAT
jgi:hypothetical protein